MESTYSLFELQQFIKRVVALNFQEPVWVEAELAQVDSFKGHLFIELVEEGPEEAGIRAQARAIIWQRQLRQLRREHGSVIDQLFQAGRAVQLLVQPQLHEQYGYRLEVQDANPDFTLGQLEQQRQAALEQLRAAGDLERNAALPLSPVIQRIALITSKTAAGLADFEATLQGNPYGYRFFVELFETTVQGVKAPTDLQKRIRQVARRPANYTAIVILRGGGARLDLAVFDDLQLCQTAAQAPIPVLTGIGHETDQSLLDLVAHRAFKTPTALAEWLLQRMLNYETVLTNFLDQAARAAQLKLQHHQQELQQIQYQVQLNAHERLHQQEHLLDQLGQQLPGLGQQNLQYHQRELQHLEQLLTTLDPQTALRRGFSLLSQNGKILTAPNQLQTEASVKIQFADGEGSYTIAPSES